MEKTILLIDGGYLRKITKKKKKKYNSEYIEKCLREIIKGDEECLLRVLYYDCPLYEGKTTLPISQETKEFENKSPLLYELGQKDFFAIRKGELKFEGYALKKESIGKDNLTDDDFEPIFKQKGVDMRIGLDIANYSHNKLVSKIILLSNDTDCVPALKYARKNGIFVELVELEGSFLTPKLILHADKKIKISLPD